MARLHAGRLLPDPLIAALLLGMHSRVQEIAQSCSGAWLLTVTARGLLQPCAMLAAGAVLAKFSNL